MGKTDLWKKVDACALWQLPCEQRAALQKSGDARFRALWADCFCAMQQSAGPDVNGAAFSEAFLACFARFQPGSNGRFSQYLRAAAARKAHREPEDSPPWALGRETARKIKKALAYMQARELAPGQVWASDTLAQTVASCAGISVKTLRSALELPRTMLSLDEEDPDTGETLGSQIPAGAETLGLQNPTAFTRLKGALNLMTLQQKEKYAQKAGPFWSSALLGYVRCSEEPDFAAERLARCADIQPLEEDGCLWGCLLLQEYVNFTVKPPYSPQPLHKAALNPLLCTDRLPHQDKTIAEFLQISRSAVSQRKKAWAKSAALLLQPPEE